MTKSDDARSDIHNYKSASVLVDTDLLSDEELKQLHQSLKSELERTDRTPTDELTRNELTLYQIELEMQNRELRAAQSVLEQSRERYVELFDYAPVGYMIVDRKGIISDTNLTAASLTGLSRKQLIGQPFVFCLTQDKTTEWFSFLYRVANIGKACTIDSTINSRQFGTRQIRITGVAHNDSSKNGTQIRLAIFDISQENAQREALRLHEVIMENMIEGVVISSQNTKTILETNPAFDKMFGYERGELIGHPIVTLNKPRTPPAVDISTHIIATIQQKGYWEGELENRRKNGEFFWTWASIRPLEHHQYGPIWLAVQRDITEQKKHEHEAKIRHDALAHLARINTVGEFAASLAHELTQPLMAIEHYNHSALQCLQSKGREGIDDTLALLQSAERQIKRAGKTIFHLRKFIRIGAVNKRPAELSDVIASAIDLVAPLLVKERVEITTMNDPKLPLVDVEPIQIEQVLVNLLRNSIDAITRDNSETRCISIETNATPNEVKVTVRDTGPGLDGDQANHIFDASEGDKKNGIGMGLAISRSLVKAHGGRLWAETRNNKEGGAEFHFTLPLTAIEAQRNEPIPDNIPS